MLFAFFFFAAPVITGFVQEALGRAHSGFDGLEAGLVAARVYVTVILILNMAGDPSMIGFMVTILSPFRRLGNLVQYINRYPADLEARFQDMRYACRLRSRGEGFHGMARRARLLLSLATAFAIEWTTVANRLEVVAFSRGEIPKLGWWKRGYYGLWTIAMGDVILLVIGFAGVKWLQIVWASISVE
ncbi:hypothetical protein [Haloferula sp.]|uniref:hypothetical protein n=1 Tax=Haloferula sp. TaxID=2497595 RepID=UPI003C70B97F